MAQSFSTVVEGLLEKYKSTGLPSRWEEATAFGAGAQAKAFFIRENREVINIIWLNKDGIRDITATLESPEESMFNFITLRNIVTFESRASPHVTTLLGIGVSGDFVVHVIPTSRAGHIYWIAGNQREANRLRAFMKVVMDDYVKAHGAQTGRR